MLDSAFFIAGLVVGSLLTLAARRKERKAVEQAQNRSAARVVRILARESALRISHRTEVALNLHRTFAVLACVALFMLAVAWPLIPQAHIDRSIAREKPPAPKPSANPCSERDR